MDVLALCYTLRNVLMLLAWHSFDSHSTVVPASWGGVSVSDRSHWLSVTVLRLAIQNDKVHLGLYE